MKNRLFVAIVALSFLLVGNSFAQNLVNNSGFETGNFSSWTQFGDTSFSGVGQAGSMDPNNSGRAPHSGLWSASFGPTAPGGISQALSTTAGASYLVSFWLENGNPQPNSVKVDFGGVTLFSAENLPGFGWTQYSFTGIADSNAAALQFTFTQPNDYFNLDDVSVLQTPEPASLTLLGSALGLGAGFIRRFRS